MSEPKSVRRVQIPLDVDRRHTFELQGSVLGASVSPLAPLVEDPQPDGSLRWTPGLDIWYEYDETSEPVERTFEVFDTGQFLPEQSRHVATVIDGAGTIRHLFEVTEV